MSSDLLLLLSLGIWHVNFPSRAVSDTLFSSTALWKLVSSPSTWTFSPFVVHPLSLLFLLILSPVTVFVVFFTSGSRYQTSKVEEDLNSLTFLLERQVIGSSSLVLVCPLLRLISVIRRRTLPSVGMDLPLRKNSTPVYTRRRPAKFSTGAQKYFHLQRYRVWVPKVKEEK